MRNLSIREKDKGLSAGEKRMLAKARQILVSELTFAMNVDEEEAEARLDEVLKSEDVPAPKKPAREARRCQEVGTTQAWTVSGASSSPRVAAIVSVEPEQFCDLAGPACRRSLGRGDERSLRRGGGRVAPRRVLGRRTGAAARGRWRDEIGFGPCRFARGTGGGGGRRRARCRAAARGRAALFDAVITAVQAGADAAVPCVPVTDTLKRVEGERVVDTVDRGSSLRCRRRKRSGRRCSAPRTSAATTPRTTLHSWRPPAARSWSSRASRSN